MAKPIRLTTNGLTMPPDFPSGVYNLVSERALKIGASNPDTYGQFVASWSAIAYRFMAVADYEREFNKSISSLDHSAETRHEQERQLFGFFSNGFSVFEASFYAAFCIGAFREPTRFPVTLPRDQQRINPSFTIESFRRAFGTDPFCELITAIAGHASFVEWREIRNILTHRATPGRTIHVSFGDTGDPLPDEWKIKNIILDKNMAPLKRRDLAGSLQNFIEGLDDFLIENI